MYTNQNKDTEDNNTNDDNVLEAKKDDDVISKDSLEDEYPKPAQPEKSPSNEEEVELVYNSMLGLYYDPKTKQHFEVKPEDVKNQA